MTANCLDLSNYSGELSAEQAQGLKDAGIDLVIVQAVAPPPDYPPGVTRQQIQACLAAGITVDAYIWLWFDLDITDIQRKLALLNRLPVRRLWLDVEDQTAVKYDQATTEAKVSAALAECDDWLARADIGGWTGIYTGRWFWADQRYMGDTVAFRDRDVWTAEYDDIPDASVFTAYGGWSSAAIKQFHGTTTLAGVPNVDLNVLAESEAAKLGQPQATADGAEDPRDKRIEDLLTTIGVIGGDVADSLANTGSVLHKQASAKRMTRAQIAGSAANVDNVVNELRRLRAAAG